MVCLFHNEARYFSVNARPRIVQCGLCLHGRRAKETHRQRECWSLHFYQYAGSLFIGGNLHAFLPGSVSLIPPGVEAQWRFPPHAAHYYVHFKCAAGAMGVFTPVLRTPDAVGTSFGNQCDELIRFFRNGERQRASIRLWDLLFQLSESRTALQTVEHLHPNLQIALAVIRNSPGEKLAVQRLAAGMGISRNQLTRLFQKEFRCGAKQYIRKIQTSRALDLLANSTLSLKSIALSCGFCDPSHFNKVIRAETSLCPTQYRQSNLKSSLNADQDGSRVPKSTAQHAPRSRPGSAGRDLGGRSSRAGSIEKHSNC
jgi:AraC-like DNA-binding protein